MNNNDRCTLKISDLPSELRNIINLQQCIKSSTRGQMEGS